MSLGKNEIAITIKKARKNIEIERHRQTKLKSKGPFTQPIFVQFLSWRFDAISVALKSHPQIACVNGRRCQCDLGTICRRDIAVVSNMFEIRYKFAAIFHKK